MFVGAPSDRSCNPLPRMFDVARPRATSSRPAAAGARCASLGKYPLGRVSLCGFARVWGDQSRQVHDRDGSAAVRRQAARESGWTNHSLRKCTRPLVGDVSPAPDDDPHVLVQIDTPALADSHHVVRELTLGGHLPCSSSATRWNVVLPTSMPTEASRMR